MATIFLTFWVIVERSQSFALVSVTSWEFDFLFVFERFFFERPVTTFFPFDRLSSNNFFFLNNWTRIFSDGSESLSMSKIYIFYPIFIPKTAAKSIQSWNFLLYLTFIIIYRQVIVAMKTSTFYSKSILCTILWK